MIDTLAYIVIGLSLTLAVAMLPAALKRNQPHHRLFAGCSDQQACVFGARRHAAGANNG